MRQKRAERLANFIDVAALAVASLAPLNLLLAVRLIGSPLWVIELLVGAALLGFLGVARVFWRACDDNEFSPTIRSVEDVGVEASGYLASFVFPLLAVQTASAQDLVAYGLFVLIYVVVLINTSLLAVNPLLYVFGLKIWRIRSDDLAGGPHLLIGRTRPSEGTPYAMTKGSRVYVQFREKVESNGR